MADTAINVSRIFWKPCLQDTVRLSNSFIKILSKNCEFWCAVYKPTGLSTIASNLIKGDKICVGGGVRKASKNFSRVVNLEFIKILVLEKNLVKSNPTCVQCNKKPLAKVCL